MTATSSDNHKFPLDSFGVGSFIFSTSSDEEESLESHMSRFIEQLRNVPGLINIQITPDHLTDRTIHAGEIELSFLNISFDIDLSAGPHSVRNENKFKFVSRSFYHSVGTLIFPQFNTEDPSDGVFRVREYLKSYLKEPYCLNVIGPSPFHADFFIRRTNFFGVEIEKYLKKKNNSLK